MRNNIAVNVRLAAPGNAGVKAAALAVCLCVPLMAGPKKASVTAEKWLNRLTLRHGDTRDLAVLFFDMHEPTRELAEHVKRLNELSRRRDVQVIAVTPEREAAGRAFIEKYRPRFAVGVQSVSYRAFSVRRFPAVVLIRGEQRTTVEDWPAILESLGPAPAGEPAPPEELSIDELRAGIEREDNPQRWRHLEVLRVRMEPEAFLRYCDELETELTDAGPAWLGPLRYQRHLADPSAAIKQPATTPAIDAYRDAVRRDERKLNELRELLASRSDWSSEEVLEVYFSHWGDEPESLVYRTDWVRALARTRDPAFVEPLLEMLEVEVDPGLRFRIALAIDMIDTDNPVPNREAVLRRLRERLAAEENVRWARPALEAAIDGLQSNAADAPER